MVNTHLFSISFPFAKWLFLYKSGRSFLSVSLSFGTRYHYDNVLSNFNDFQVHIYNLTLSYIWIGWDFYPSAQRIRLLLWLLSLPILFRSIPARTELNMKRTTKNIVNIWIWTIKGPNPDWNIQYWFYWFFSRSVYTNVKAKLVSHIIIDTGGRIYQKIILIFCRFPLKRKKKTPSN